MEYLFSVKKVRTRAPLYFSFTVRTYLSGKHNICYRRNSVLLSVAKKCYENPNMNLVKDFKNCALERHLQFEEN